ncbi:MAG: hypothetical protein NVS3B21_15100 [Acidimicrobiales bacterium]
MKRAIAWLVAAAFGIGLSAPAVLMATAAPAAAADAGTEAQFLSLTNADRAANGLAPLVLDARLTPIARGWSDQLMAAGALSHNPGLANALPSDWLTYGENVGMGQNPAGLETAFMNSPAHRANIMGDYRSVGIGVDIRSDGTMFVTLDFLKSSSAAVASAPACTSSNPPAAPSPNGARGYYVLGNDGGIFSYNAPFRGSVPGTGSTEPAALMAVTPSQGGYWVLGRHGGVFGFGDARFLGSVPGASTIDLKPTRSGNGYWILGQDGSVWSFGDARNMGSLPAAGVHTTAVKLVPTPSGNGYWILGVDGGIFSFGDAAFHGSLPGLHIANTSVSMAATPSGNGYWVLGADGGIFSFGDAAFHGSVPGIGCTTAQGVQLVSSATGAGYYILASDGRVFAFGDAPSYGQPSALHVNTLDLAVLHN